MSDSYEKNLSHFVRQLPGFAAWKTLDSKYASANALCARLAGYDSVDSYIGTTDYDWKCRAVEFADTIVQQDQLVLAKGKPWQSFNILKFSNGDFTHYFSQKSILQDPNGKILGILFIGTIIDSSEIIKSLELLTHQEPQKATTSSTCHIFPISKNMGNLNLSERQSECLFYLIRGKTAKEISAILKISARTIETFLEQIKCKLDCHSKSQLIDKAISLGYWHHIPASLVKKTGVISIPD